MCAGNPRGVSRAIKILSFQNFYEVLKTCSAGRKDFFDTLQRCTEWYTAVVFSRCFYVSALAAWTAALPWGRYPLCRKRGKAKREYTVTAIRFPALMGRQSCHFLESTSLYPPPAALWCFPLWKSLPRKDGGATVEREAEDVLFAAPVCEGLSGAGTH